MSQRASIDECNQIGCDVHMTLVFRVDGCCRQDNFDIQFQPYQPRHMIQSSIEKSAPTVPRHFHLTNFEKLNTTIAVLFCTLLQTFAIGIAAAAVVARKKRCVGKHEDTWTCAQEGKKCLVRHIVWSRTGTFIIVAHSKVHLELAQHE